jgi:hypothetical protein
VPQTKVTLALDNDSLAFFKREARRRNTSYQRMIRNLVRSYARAHAPAKQTRLHCCDADSILDLPMAILHG